MSLATIGKLAAAVAVVAFLGMLVGYGHGDVTAGQLGGSALTGLIAVGSCYAAFSSKKTING